MALSYGQFGTPGYASSDVPPNIVDQYAGTKNLQQALGMYGNLLYGPLSKGYQVTAAQANDPTAQAFQAPTGGEFGTPGAGSTQLGTLFGGAFGANVAGQQAKQQQQTKAAGGMLDTANAYANNIYNMQTSANQLQEAKLQAQEQQEKAMIQLGIMAAELATGNYGAAVGSGLSAMGTPGGGGMSGVNPFQPQPGSLYSSTFGSGSAAPSGAAAPPTSGTLSMVDPNMDPSLVDMYAQAAGYY